MTFNHQFYEFPPLTREDTDTGRFYTLPTGERYPSVTTILGRADDGSGLAAWRARVGAEEADRIGRMAANRGTKIHTMAEKYLLNESNPTKGQMPINVVMFKALKEKLDNISTVYGIECGLFSHTLRSAGSTDIFAKYKDLDSIVDNKTSIREKRAEWIEDYFIQTTAYVIMVEEMFKIHIPQLVVLITNQEGTCQEFIRSPDDYRSKTIDLFRKYND